VVSWRQYRPRHEEERILWIRSRNGDADYLVLLGVELHLVEDERAASREGLAACDRGIGGERTWSPQQEQQEGRQE
jgi:hypothetical protein